MAIEWLVHLSCEPKKALGVGELVRRIKQRSQGEAAIEAARSGGDRRPPKEITLQVVRQGPNGNETTSITAAALLEAGSALDPLAHHCVGCVANVGKRPFGCYGSIRYPLTDEAERWLLARLPARLDTTAGVLLRRAVADFKYDGAPLKALRARKLTERPAPRTRSWGDYEISADQLFHLLFFVGALQPSHCAMIALFFGLVPHDLDGDAIRAALSDARAREKLFGTIDVGLTVGDAPQVVALGAFLEGVATAARLSVPLAIDA